MSQQHECRLISVADPDQTGHFDEGMVRGGQFLFLYDLPRTARPSGSGLIVLGGQSLFPCDLFFSIALVGGQTPNDALLSFLAVPILPANDIEASEGRTTHTRSAPSTCSYPALGHNTSPDAGRTYPYPVIGRSPSPGVTARLMPALPSCRKADSALAHLSH